MRFRPSSRCVDQKTALHRTDSYMYDTRDSFIEFKMSTIIRCQWYSATPTAITVPRVDVSGASAPLTMVLLLRALRPVPLRKRPLPRSPAALRYSEYLFRISHEVVCGCILPRVARPRSRFERCWNPLPWDPPPRAQNSANPSNGRGLRQLLLRAWGRPRRQARGRPRSTLQGEPLV